MKKHMGSTIALIIGVLGLLSGLSQLKPVFFSGVLIILGALAYRSAKKRKLGEVRSSLTRKVVEIMAIVIGMAPVVLQNNLQHAMINDPVPNIIIPIWVLVAYIIATDSKLAQ